MIGQSAAKSYAYILGVYLGDGCVTGGAFRLNTIDADFAAAVVAALSDLTTHRIGHGWHPVQKSKKPNFYVRCGDRSLCQRLVETTDDKARLPRAVWTWPRDHQLAFVVGLMDSEGFVAANSNLTNRRYYMGFKACDPWVPEFIVLLQKLGIRIGKVSQEAPRRPGYRTPTRFAIKMQSWLDAGGYFNIRRKEARVEEWASAGAYEHRAKNPRRLSSETTRRTPPVEVMI